MDYYIVCTEQPEDVIVRVGFRYDLDEKPSQYSKTREEVIRDLDLGKVIYTAHSYSSASGYKLGAKVRKIWVGGKAFISTEWNNLKRDNLDNIRKCNFK